MIHLTLPGFRNVIYCGKPNMPIAQVQKTDDRANATCPHCLAISEPKADLMVKADAWAKEFGKACRLSITSNNEHERRGMLASEGRE